MASSPHYNPRESTCSRRARFERLRSIASILPMRKFRVARTLLVALLIAFVGAGVVAWQWYRTPLPLPQSPFDFEVKPGSTLSAVARELHAAGAVPQPLALIALARATRVDRSIKAGSYEIEQ